MENKEIQFNAKEGIESLCEKNKVFFTEQGSNYEDLISVGLGNLLYDKLNQIIKKNKKGFHILNIKNPDTKQEYKVEIKIEDNEEIEIFPKIELNGDYIGQGQFGTYVKIDNVVEDLLKLYSFKTIYGKRGEDVWCYNNKNGIWTLDGRALIKTQAEKLLGKYGKIGPINEIFEKIKRLTEIKKEDFDNTPEELICVNNGVINVKTKELLPFDPEYNFKTKLDLTYNPQEDCPEIKKFFEETFYPDDNPVIQEWLGFHLYKRYFIKKAMILFGPKDTGKTIFLNLLTRFVGENNKTGISLHLITKNDKFTLQFLKDKLANIYDDLSFKDLNDAGGFKIACGGGRISAEYKFGDSFEFMNYAKNTFATNKIPVLDSDPDDAYYLRWIPIPCDSEISEEEQDKFLIDKLTTEKELSGLLNYALEGLQRLLKKGKFSFEKSVEEVKNLMEKNSNHFVAFVTDCLIRSPGERITKEEMFELYKCYAEQNNLKMHSKTQLGRGLEKYAPFISAKREKERYWEGAGIDPKNKTLTTLLKNLRGLGGNIYRHLDMVSQEASNVSKDLPFTPEQIESCGYTEKELKEVLEDGN